MKIGAEAILAVIVAPIVIWFLSFVLNTYQVAAEVSNIKEDVIEIKADVKSLLINQRN